MNAHSPESCASCARTDCHLSFVSRRIEPVAERTSFVVDEVWPEHRQFVAGQFKGDDQLIAPHLPGQRLGRYDWGPGQDKGKAQGAAIWATVARHVAMRQVAKARGAVRQAAYLKADEAIALALAARIDYRARHLVISQTLLPFLWRDGALGGRSFDVLMTRYPFGDLHARLDAFHLRHPDSDTIHDFRAPDALVAAEAEALAAARRVVTPHHDIAEGFGACAIWLDWQRPPVRPRLSGRRVAFLGPVITRQGAHEARQLARGLDAPLVVFGSELEGAGFWDGVAIERRTMGPDWLDGIGSILHPAAITHAPRKLVEAVAQGVTVFAHASCGLAPGQYRPFESFGDI